MAKASDPFCITRDGARIFVQHRDTEFKRELPVPGPFVAAGVSPCGLMAALVSREQVSDRHTVYWLHVFVWSDLHGRWEAPMLRALEGEACCVEWSGDEPPTFRLIAREGPSSRVRFADTGEWAIMS
jgi:hypothetical protein